MSNISKHYFNQEVCQLLFQLLAICIDHNLFSVFIGTLKFIGDLGFEMGEYDKAMGFYYELYKLCIKIGNFQYQYNAVFGMANVCIKKGNFEDALKMLKKGIFYAWYLEDLDKELDCYEKVSFCFYNLSCLDECIYYHNRALRGQREQDNLEKTQKIRQIESLKEKILAGDCLHFCSGHFLQARFPVLSLEQFPYKEKIEDYQFNFKFVFQQEKEEEVEQSIIFDDNDNINENENEKFKDFSDMQENSNFNFKSYDQIKNEQEFQHNISQEKDTSKQNEIYQNNQDQMESMRERINSSIEDYNYANTKISFDLNQNSNFDFNKSQQIKIKNQNQNQDLVKSIMRSQMQQKGDKQKLQENYIDNNNSSKNNFLQKNLSSGAKFRQKYSENQDLWLEMKYQDIKEQYFQEKDNELNLDFPKYEEKFEKPQIVKQIMRKFRIYDQEDPKQRTNYKNLQYEYIQNKVFDRKRRFSKENTQKGRFEQIKKEIAKELKIESYQDQNQNKNKIQKNQQNKQLQQKNKRSVTDFMLYENSENYKQVYKYYKELNKKRNNLAQQNLLLSKGINRDAVNNKIYLTSNGQNEGDQKDKKAKFQYRMFLDNLFVNGKVQI
ncbi:hypothetical protein PPERSA_00166 [Pseudocohnilembus persalinus]|uniref:Tetratricopeptide repeat protein n=1 Tax=Pseudocohnilembus persalinus TaxID=266149 RepID=A0A0V0QHN5_PSEPJ|nr:hypothetical protein PPERSA_00166 [Pseudocohnilembus persalinus]|eukprot:KRX01793.1 hypothetical protein PPERSA_00166 [Pseudocohnilembus persalinus]